MQLLELAKAMLTPKEKPEEIRNMELTEPLKERQLSFFNAETAQQENTTANTTTLSRDRLSAEELYRIEEYDCRRAIRNLSLE